MVQRRNEQQFVSSHRNIDFFVMQGADAVLCGVIGITMVWMKSLKCNATEFSYALKSL